MIKLVPDEFEAPLDIDFPDFIFRPLNESVAELDYEAVMSSRSDLCNIFGRDDSWPSDDMTLEQNREDLRGHWNLFEARSSFAWTVLDLEGDRCVGCVYFYWPLLPEHDATVYLWARSDELSNGLDGRLETTVKSWIAETWPFASPAFPGRDIPWDEWKGGMPESPEGAG